MYGVIMWKPCATRAEDRLMELGYLHNIRVNVSAWWTSMYQCILCNSFVLTLHGCTTYTNAHIIQHRNYVNKKLGLNQVIGDYYQIEYIMRTMNDNK